jgi:hypothetical protein
MFTSSTSASRLPLCLLLGLALGACATSTPYQPATGKGPGYSEQKLESNRFRVDFAGNSRTPRKTVENYLLYRAAELTLANQGDYFVIAHRDVDKDTSYTQSFSGGIGTYGWFPDHFGTGIGISSGTASPRDKYLAQADILVFKGKKPETATNAFDARAVIENLEQVIERPATS